MHAQIAWPVHALLGDVAGAGTGITTAGICGRAVAVDIFAEGPCALALGCDVTGVGTGNATAGILGRAVDGRVAVVEVFADISVPCALTLGCTRQTSVQKIAN